MITQPTTGDASGVRSAKGTRERALKLWVVLARAHGAVARRAEADIAQDGLTPAEFGVLEVLLHKGRLRIGEIQEKVLVTSGGMTYLIDRLAARGLVRRVACREDRRVYHVELTGDGESLMAAAFERHAECLTRVLGELSAAEQEQVTRLLRRLGHAAAAGQADASSDA